MKGYAKWKISNATNVKKKTCFEFAIIVQNAIHLLPIIKSKILIELLAMEM